MNNNYESSDSANSITNVDATVDGSNSFEQTFKALLFEYLKHDALPAFYTKEEFEKDYKKNRNKLIRAMR